MKNYKIIVAYDGSRYKGWQRLGRKELTLQDTLEKCIESVLYYKVEIHGSGRTDAGVHARGQVVSMKIPFFLQDDFVYRVNENLPEDIRIISAERVKGEFHARYSATRKTYCYYVDRKKSQMCFEENMCVIIPMNLMWKRCRWQQSI